MSKLLTLRNSNSVVLVASRKRCHVSNIMAFHQLFQPIFTSTNAPLCSLGVLRKLHDAHSTPNHVRQTSRRRTINGDTDGYQCSHVQTAVLPRYDNARAEVVSLSRRTRPRVSAHDTLILFGRFDFRHVEVAPPKLNFRGVRVKFGSASFAPRDDSFLYLSPRCAGCQRHRRAITPDRCIIRKSFGISFSIGEHLARFGYFVGFHCPRLYLQTQWSNLSVSYRIIIDQHREDHNFKKIDFTCHVSKDTNESWPQISSSTNKTRTLPTTRLLIGALTWKELTIHSFKWCHFNFSNSSSNPEVDLRSLLP